jgi:hypothetical protein
MLSFTVRRNPHGRNARVLVGVVAIFDARECDPRHKSSATGAQRGADAITPLAALDSSRPLARMLALGKRPVLARRHIYKPL